MTDILRTRRRVRLRDLETLSAVVHAGGMRKAAEALHLSQPAVSKAIAELEDGLGVRLLERGRGGTVPTAFGEALVNRSRAVFDELDGALRELAYLADPASGEVRLGCMETLHAGLIGATVDRVLRRHPRMRLALEMGQSPDLIEHFLRGRRVDFVAARPLTLPLPPDVEGEPLFRDIMKVMVGLDSRFARRRRITLAELVDETWILSRNEVTPSSPVVRAFAEAGVAFPRKIIESGSLTMRVNLLASGRYVTLMPHSLQAFGLIAKLVRALPIEIPPWSTPTMILTLRGRTLGPAAGRFLETLRELARPLDLDAARNP